MTVIKREALHGLLQSLSKPTAYGDAVRTLHVFSRVNIPPFLYRYRRCGTEYSFDDIEKGQITLSSASHFGDFDDSAIHDMGELDAFVNALYSQNDVLLRSLNELVSKVQKCGSEDGWDRLIENVNKFFSLSKEEQKRFLDDWRGRIRSLIDIEECSRLLRSRQKIACFCVNRNSDYMWKNYADNGAGYLIEYDTSSLYSIDASHKRVPLILPVVYRSEPVDTLLLPLLAGVSDMANAIVDEEILDGRLAISLISTVFCKRSDPFAKEEEWRLMLAPQDSERDEEFIFRDLKPFRLIAGPNMSLKDKRRLCDCADNIDIAIAEQTRIV